MIARHHISDDLLLSYAAGSLAEGWSLAVATHLSLCGRCRERLGMAEAAGGQLLETLGAEAVSDQSWAAVRARLGTPPRTEPAPQPETAILPRPPLRYGLGDW